VIEPRPHHVLRAGRAALSRLARIRPLLAGGGRAHSMWGAGVARCCTC
jgi:hypothetical protein